MNFFRKSQGEIFGIALMFVVIIIGILVYGKIQSLNPDNSLSDLDENKYKVLAEGTLNSVLKMSTGCYIEKGDDELIDLVNFCVENSRDYNSDPTIDCSGEIKNSCLYVNELINKTMFGFLNTSVLGPIPFKLLVSLPSDPNNLLNKNYSNFGQYKFRGKTLIEKLDVGTDRTKFISYRKAGFNRAPSGIRGWAKVIQAP